jgi:hypothetical protein
MATRGKAEARSNELPVWEMIGMLLDEEAMSDTHWFHLMVRTAILGAP